MIDTPDLELEQLSEASAHPARWLKSVRARLVAVILIALLPAFVLLMTVASSERNRAATAAAAEQMVLARLAGTQYMEMISTTQQFMSWAALYPEIRTGDSDACKSRLRQLLSDLSDFGSLSVTGPNGEIICTASRLPITEPPQLADSPYLRNVVETGRFAIGGLNAGIAAGKPNITFGMPILGDDGTLTRVLGAGLDVELLNRRLIGVNLPNDAILSLTDGDGRVILRSNDPAAHVGQVLPAAAAIGDEAALEGVARYPGLDGVDRQYVWTTINYGGEGVFHILVGYSDERVFGPVNRLLRNSLIGLSLVTLLALLAAWLGAQKMIVRSIDRLVRVANRMRDGNLLARTGLTTDPGEFGQLAIALESLAASLDEGKRENQQLIAEMQTLNAGLEETVSMRTQELETANSRLVESQHELRMLSHALIAATEVERTRISGEIHDQVGQMITAVKMELSNLRKRLPARNSADFASSGNEVEEAGNAIIDAKINDISRLLDETVTLVRQMSTDLRPGVLDDFGLVAAAEAHLGDFEKRTAIHCEFVADVDESLLSPQAGTTAFRVLQGALENLAHHDHAMQVTVELKTGDGLLSLRILDNGQVAPPDTIPLAASLDLIGMRERASQLGGTITLTGAQGGGGVLTLQLPVAPPHNDGAGSGE